MGSMRNPVGPLPSSIYWRRRAVAASLIALLAVLIAWAVTSGGGNGGSGDAKADGPDPANSITPGPSGSGPAISQQPGGRDESGEDAGSDAGNGDTEPGGTGGTDATGSPGATPSGTGGASGADGATGQQVPAGSPLPDCKPTALRLSLKTEVSYGPDDKPVFRLIAKNTSAATCKADLGPKNAVLTITEAGGEDDRIWSSEDCPAASGHLFLKIPAGATVVHTVEWDRKKSSPQCASAPTTEAGPGTYLLEAKAPGVPLQRASFVLPKD